MDQIFSDKLRQAGVSIVAIQTLQEQEFETEQDLSRGFTYEQFLGMGIKAKSAAILAELYPPNTGGLANASSESVVRFMADLPENLPPPELIDRIMVALLRKEEPDKKYVDELRKRFPGNYFVRDITTDQLDPAASKALIAQVGTRRRPPTDWKGITTETIDQVLARQIYADPFTGVGIYDETNMWLQLSVEDREAIIYLRVIKGVHLDPVNTHTQLLAQPRSSWWDTQMNEWQSVKKKTDQASLQIVARVQTRMYLQEGGSRTSTNPFDATLITASSQVQSNKVNMLVLYHQRQYGHYQVLTECLDAAVLDYDINLIGVSNESRAFHMGDLEQVQICLLLMSAALISWLGKDGYELQAHLQALYQKKGIVIIPIKVAPYEKTAMSPFAQLQVIPRDEKAFPATDQDKWTDLSKEIRSVYLPRVVSMWMAQMNLEQLRQLCGLLNFQAPFADAAIPTTIQQLLTAYNNSGYGFTIENLAAKIITVRRPKSSSFLIE